MPTVEDYFDDETDIPLPVSSSSRTGLQGSGLQGALLEEITDDNDLDFGTLAEQGRGEYGANSVAPPPSENAKGKLAVRDEPGVVRPSAPGGAMPPHMNPNTPMGGFMGDMMKLQEAEEARMAKMRAQFGGANVAGDPNVYKSWNSVYPLYFDAKVSINGGRRVPRKSSLWWPLAAHIAKACATLGLPSVLEPEKTHPADWENPGRVKVNFEKDGRFINPIITNRSQLYTALAQQMQDANPDLVPKPVTPRPKTEAKPAAATSGKSKKDKKGKNKAAAAVVRPPVRKPTQAPDAPRPFPALDARLPLHSPLVEAGVALSAVKRDLENDKDLKKKGLLGGNAGGASEEGGKEKMPKMKRVVVRGGRR